MANLPESDSFDAGVYQLETTDPALGGANGVMNTPAKALVNRTRYLYNRLQEILGISKGYVVATGTANAVAANYTPAIVAVADGQEFSFKVTASNTGAATFTPCNGTVAGTTAIPPCPIYGLDLQPLAGNELVGQCRVRFNSALNSGNGAYVLIENAGGIRRAIAPPTSDNGNAVPTTSWIRSIFAPLISPPFTGSPTAPTPAAADNSSKLATTAFVIGRLTDGTVSPTFGGGTFNNPVTVAAATTPGQVINLGQADGRYQPVLGYTPVQQGGGSGQATNKIQIGWASDASGLKAQVDSTDLGLLALVSHLTDASINASFASITVQNGGNLKFAGTTGYYYMNSTAGAVRIPVGGQFYCQDTTSALAPCNVANATAATHAATLSQVQARLAAANVLAPAKGYASSASLASNASLTASVTLNPATSGYIIGIGTHTKNNTANSVSTNLMVDSTPIGTDISSYAPVTEVGVLSVSAGSHTVKYTVTNSGSSTESMAVMVLAFFIPTS
jgi:hypothetical protein